MNKNFFRNFLDNFQIFSDFLRFLTLSLISVQEGATYPSTLDASRLKIVFRSVDSDLESTSEAKKTRLHFLRKCNHFLRKSGRKIWDYLRKISFSKKKFRKKCIFPFVLSHPPYTLYDFISVISCITLLMKFFVLIFSNFDRVFLRKCNLNFVLSWR